MACQPLKLWREYVEQLYICYHIIIKWISYLIKTTNLWCVQSYYYIKSCICIWFIQHKLFILGNLISFLAEEKGNVLFNTKFIPNHPLLKYFSINWFSWERFRLQSLYNYQHLKTLNLNLNQAKDESQSYLRSLTWITRAGFIKNMPFMLHNNIILYERFALWPLIECMFSFNLPY